MTPEDKKTMLANLSAETQAQYERAVFPVEVLRDKDGDVPIDDDGDVGVCVGLDCRDDGVYIDYRHRHISHYCRPPPPFREYWQNLYADGEGISGGVMYRSAQDARQNIHAFNNAFVATFRVVIQNDGDTPVLTLVPSPCE